MGVLDIDVATSTVTRGTRPKLRWGLLKWICVLIRVDWVAARLPDVNRATGVGAHLKIVAQEGDDCLNRSWVKHTESHTIHESLAPLSFPDDIFIRILTSNHQYTQIP